MLDEHPNLLQWVLPLARRDFRCRKSCKDSLDWRGVCQAGRDAMCQIEGFSCVQSRRPEALDRCSLQGKEGL